MKSFCKVHLKGLMTLSSGGIKKCYALQIFFLKISYQIMCQHPIKFIVVEIEFSNQSCSGIGKYISL